MSRRFVTVVVLLCVARVVAATLLATSSWTQSAHNALSGDVSRWHVIAEARGVPYRDVRIEYPPLVLAAAKLLDAPHVHELSLRVIWSQLVLDLLTAAGLAYGWGRRTALAYLLLGLAFAVWPFIYMRLDLLAVVLAVWGLALARRRAPVAGGFLVGLACFAKLWPLVLIPTFAVQRRWRALTAALVTGATGLLAWVAWGTTRGIRDVVTFRGAKGWQIESVVGALVRAISSARVHGEQGAVRVGQVSAPARGGLMIGLLATVAIVWYLVSRVADPSAGIVDGVVPLAALAAVLAFAPILSPQYAVWLLPFAAIAAADDERGIALIATLVCGLSTLLMYATNAVGQGDQWVEVVLMLRNAAVVALIPVGIWSLARARRVAPVTVPVH